MKKFIALTVLTLVMVVMSVHASGVTAVTTEPIIQATFSTNPATVAPGNDGYIQLTLKNSGTVAASRIKISSVSWDTHIIPSGTWMVELGSLGAGDSATALFKFSVSSVAPSGLYAVNFGIDYCDGSSCRTINSNAIITVQSVETDFDVSVQDSTATSTTLAIANIGANTAYSVIVNIPQQENYRVTGASTSVVGNLNVGDYTLASFQITPITPTRTAQNISEAGEKTLVVKVSYTDTLGARRTVQKEVKLSIATTIQEGATTRQTQVSQWQLLGSSGLMYMGIGVVGIVGVVVFLKFRKRIKRKKE